MGVSETIGGIGLVTTTPIGCGILADPFDTLPLPPDLELGSHIQHLGSQGDLKRVQQIAPSFNGSMILACGAL